MSLYTQNLIQRTPRVENDMDNTFVLCGNKNTPSSSLSLFALGPRDCLANILAKNHLLFFKIISKNRVIWKVTAKTPVCILKEESAHQTILCTKTRQKKKFGPEYEATN